MAFRWRADDDPTLNAGLVAVIFQGIRTSIAKEPYIFCNFLGGSGPPVPPSGSAHALYNTCTYTTGTSLTTCICQEPETMVISIVYIEGHRSWFPNKSWNIEQCSP